MKIIICILLTGTCSLLGFFKSKEYQNRCDFYYSLVLFCTNYLVNLEYTRAPVGTLIQQACQNKMFLAAYTQYCKLEDGQGEKGQFTANFNTEEQRYIKDFFEFLGSQDSFGERERTLFFNNYFSNRLDKCKQEYNSNGKLAQKLGVAAGIMLSILVI